MICLVKMRGDFPESPKSLKRMSLCLLDKGHFLILLKSVVCQIKYLTM